MTMVFKKMNILFLLLFFLGSFILICNCTKSNFILIISLIIFLALFCMVAAAIISTKRLNKIMNLWGNCHVAEFVEKLEKLLKSKRSKPANDYILLNLFSGYLDLGNIQRAKSYIMSVTLDPKEDQQQFTLKCMYYNGLTDLYISSCEPEKAAVSLENFKKVMSNPKFKSAGQFNQAYSNKKMRLQILNGNYDDARSFFEMALDVSNPLIYSVRYNYWLSEICIHEGDTVKAEEHLNFVIQNGGDTMYVGLANEKLKELHK